MKRITRNGNKTICTGMPLSKKELIIYNYLLTDLTTEEIAEKLFVSIRTVKFHRNNIYVKKGVNRRVQLIVRHYQSIIGIRSAA
uniref:LuxR C-terminal-related transcriptional regulator n=1 Tax=Ningiella ruwaisensis TaxID=2364274 RepID=UPI00109FCED1